MLVATLASLGYGWAYQRSGRLEVAILAHFGLNLLHLTLFIYPMLIKEGIHNAMMLSGEIAFDLRGDLLGNLRGVGRSGDN